jgi:hypothetical protein
MKRTAFIQLNNAGSFKPHNSRAFKDQIPLKCNNVMMPLAIFNKGAWCFADLRNNAPVGCFGNT